MTEPNLPLVPPSCEDPGRVANTVRADIDRYLTARAPNQREAFWHAVALYYGRPAPIDGPHASSTASGALPAVTTPSLSDMDSHR